MSAENLELAKRILPAKIELVEVVESEDPPGNFLDDLSLVDQDLEVEFVGTQSGAPALHYRGIDGLIDGWREWLVPYERYILEVEELIDAGDRIVTFVAVRARTARHGVELEHSPAAVLTISGGKLVAVHFFLERDEALKFAGIES
jgi:ketosteroid isomerase-like protein